MAFVLKSCCVIGPAHPRIVFCWPRPSYKLPYLAVLEHMFVPGRWVFVNACNHCIHRHADFQLNVLIALVRVFRGLW